MGARATRTLGLDALVLLLLTQGEKYGTEILQTLNRTVSAMAPGSLYTTLHRMESKGLIEGRWVGRVRYYKLTEKGQKAVAEVQTLVAALKGFSSK